MFFNRANPLENRLRKLRAHLRDENPLLLDVVKSFRVLDRVAYQVGLQPNTTSFAVRVPWWPMVAVMGTFSSGKSTFINHFLGQPLQHTGNQAVDDKFTVISYGSEDDARVLPGLALDADPRFPFYQVSRDIEQVAEGEGQRVDSYLQLKTCRCDALKGRILIDSPGFDADAQRTAILRIADHIIDLSDLVLVFFDARHPEPGAMRDTLSHLVAKTVQRHDSNKFLYVLNQIDNAAREDNPEDVVAAWQRAIAQEGLTAGHFYTIYDPDAAIPIDDHKLADRFRSRRDADVAKIVDRVARVETERAYRIIGVLEKTARDIEDRLVPAVQRAKSRWLTRLFRVDASLGVGLLVGALAFSVWRGYWDGLRFVPPWSEFFLSRPWLMILVAVALLGLMGYAHYWISRLIAGYTRRELERDRSLSDIREWALSAFNKNVNPWQPAFSSKPLGWNIANRKRIARVLGEADRYVQILNNQFADPSGRTAPPEPSRVFEASDSAPDGTSGDQALGSSSEAGSRAQPGDGADPVTGPDEPTDSGRDVPPRSAQTSPEIPSSKIG